MLILSRSPPLPDRKYTYLAKKMSHPTGKDLIVSFVKTIHKMCVFQIGLIKGEYVVRSLIIIGEVAVCSDH